MEAPAAPPPAQPFCSWSWPWGVTIYEAAAAQTCESGGAVQPAHVLAAVPSGALGSEARAPAAPARMRALRGRRDVPPAAPRPPTLGSEIAGRQWRGRLGAGGSTGKAGKEELGAGLLPRHGGGLQCPPHRLCRQWTARRVGKRPPPCRHASDHQLAHPQGEEAIVQPDPQHPCTWVACGTGVQRGRSGGEGPPGLVTYHSREVVVIHALPLCRQVVRTRARAGYLVLAAHGK